MMNEQKRYYHRRNYGALGKIIPRRMNNGTWRFDIRWMDENGRWHHQVVKHAVTEVDAWKELIRINEQVRLKRENPEKAEEMSKKRITGAELVEKCEESYFPLLREGQNRAYIARKQFLPNFGDAYIETITSEDVARFKANRMKEKIKNKEEFVSEATAVYEITIFRAMMFKAEEWGYKVPKKNPFSGKIAKGVDNVRRRTLKDEANEEERLFAELPEHTKKISNCSLMTAMRKGEIQGLRWSDIVDLYLPGCCYIYLEWERNKSKRNRKVPVCEDMRREFISLKAENGSDPNGHVFLYKGKPVKDIKVSFKKACERAGIEDLHFHDLRRTAATRMLNRGANVVQIQQILGHANIETTMRYLGIDIEDLRPAVELLNRSNGVEIENKQKMEEKSLTTVQVPLPFHQGYEGRI